MGDWELFVGGDGEGPVLVLEEPLSFWGGLDVSTGRIIDVHHPQHGESVTGTVLVVPYARGSSSTASALAESIHRGTGPAAIVLAQRDELIVLGALVPGELYGKWCPVAVASDAIRDGLATGQVARMTDAGVEVVAAGDD